MPQKTWEQVREEGRIAMAAWLREEMRELLAKELPQEGEE
jgi:hypothetical protein